MISSRPADASDGRRGNAAFRDVERGFVLPSERVLMDSGVWDTPSGMFIQFVSGVLHALNWGSVN
nr:hypothetical protein JVH1_7021 [Rhodococcus sp. JVH1]